MNDSEDFDILFSAWILSCNDENPIITYEGIRYRLGLSTNYDVRKLINSRGELFRKGISLQRLNRWKEGLKSGQNSLPAHIRALQDKNARLKAIESLTPDDVFRNQFRAGDQANQCTIEVIDWGLQHIERRRKASIEVREASSKWKLPLFTTLLSVITTLFITYLASNWTLSNQIRLNNAQRRQQVFGELMGRKALMKQLYVSRFEALIFSDYHEARWHLAGSPKESLDNQEAQRWMHKSEDLALEIAKNNQALFETLGLIKSVFQNTSRLYQLVEKLFQLKSPKILGKPFEMNKDQLELWKNKAVKDLQDFVDQEYGKPIEELVEYLSAELSEVK